MSIEKITSKIIGDAEEKKQTVLAEAKDKAEEILAAARAEADAYLAGEIARGEAAKETLISRHKSVADIDCRKVTLAKKQELLDSWFVQAVASICALPDEDYVEFLVALGKATGETEGRLIFNEKDKVSVGEKVCSALTQAVDGGVFTLAEETKNIAGGFVLQAGNVYMNNTVEALVAEHKEIMTSEAHKVLFE